MSTEIESRFANIESRIRTIEERLILNLVTITPEDVAGRPIGYRTEPAPGSDAEHPPVGYVLVPHASGEVIEADWIVWSFDRGPWKPLRPDSVGDRAHGGFHPMARPIPANEGDSRLAESVAIPTEPARDLSAEVETQKKLDLQWEAVKALEVERNALIGERSDLRATVERLEAENAELRAAIDAKNAEFNVFKSDALQAQQAIARIMGWKA